MVINREGFGGVFCVETCVKMYVLVGVEEKGDSVCKRKDTSKKSNIGIIE